MEFPIISKEDQIPAFDPSEIAVKHIEYYPFGDVYEQEDINQDVISKLLKEIPEGFNGYFFLNPDGESDWMEVVSDGEWLFLGCCFEDEETGEFDCWYCYNPEFAHTADLLEDADFSDESVYTPIESGGQSPIPKIQALQNMEIGVKAVDYFIHTGKPYPGIDWLRD